MSKRVLELLKSLDLVDGKGKPADLMRMADVDLRKAMDDYSAARLAELEADRENESSRTGFAALMTSGSFGSFKDDPNCLLTSSLVYEKVFVDDPLLEAAHTENRLTHSRTSVMAPASALDRKLIMKRIRYVVELAPLISNGIVSVIPVSRRHRGNKGIPIFFSDDNFNSAIPAHIRSFVYESARIAEASRGVDGIVLLPTRPEKPTRTIGIYFAQDGFERPPELFFLTEIVGAERTGDGLRVKQDLNLDAPVSQEEYDIWLRNATNRAVLNCLSDASFEIALADSLNAMYLTDSAFEAKLLALSSNQELPADSRATAVNFLTANTGFLNIQSATQVANLRADNPVVFEKFRESLLHVSSQLMGVNERFEEKAKQLYVKEVDPQVQVVNAQLSKTKMQAAVSGLLAASPFSLALLNLIDIPFGITLTAVVGTASAALVQGIAGTLPAIAERLQTKRTPAYIWSQIAKK